MANWLYPISRSSGNWFGSVPASFESFRRHIVAKSRRTADWGLTTAFKQVRVGHVVWIYTGDDDVGIFGRAVVERIPAVQRPNEHFVRLRWDIPRCRELVLRTLPAPEVRRYVRAPRAPVVGLDRHPALLRRLDAWPREQERADRLALRPLNLKPIRTVRIGATSSRTALLSHDHHLRPVVRLLEGAKWQVGTPDTGVTEVDVGARRGRQIVLVEGKTLRSATGREEARQAFAQLSEYRWTMERGPARGFTFHLWAAFSRRPPSQAAVEFLEDQGILVSWRTKSGIDMLDSSNRLLKKLTARTSRT